jgi:hypothetical protein
MTSFAGESTNPMKQTIYHTLYQVKNVVTKKLTSKDIEGIIKTTRDAGGRGFKSSRYGSDKMGWSLEDSKGREVYVVIFSFLGGRAKEGDYLGPLMSFQNAKELHSFHEKTLLEYFKQIDNNKYDLNDNCTASLRLFHGTTGLGRTIITVECH